MQEPQTVDEYFSLREYAKQNSMLTVVKFTADWCSVCKDVQPKLNELAAEFPNVQFICYDVEGLDNDDVTSDIRALPTFKIFKGDLQLESFAGNNVDRIRGVITK